MSDFGKPRKIKTETQSKEEKGERDPTNQYDPICHCGGNN